jgi:hypothetical protein
LRAFLAFGSTVVTDRPPSLAAHANRDPRGLWHARPTFPNARYAGVDAAGAAGRRSSARSVGARSIERDGVDVAANIRGILRRVGRVFERRHLRARL